MNRFIYSLVAIYLRVLIGNLSKKSSYSTIKRIALELALLRKQIQIMDNPTTKRKTLSKWDRLEIASLTQIGDAKALARRCAILFKPETSLKCHRYFVKRKYSKLYGEKPKKRGPKGKSKPLVDLVIEIKKNNLDYGCEKIAGLLTARGHPISHSTIRRILKKHGYDDDRLKTGPSSCLPSFLPHAFGRHGGRGAALGISFNRLWVTDFFKVESAFCRPMSSWWSWMSTHEKLSALPPDLTLSLATMSVMFNSTMGNANPPKKLCHDRDPLFNYYRWQANMKILEHLHDFEELRSIAYVPVSNPFIERLIGITRQEYFKNIFFLSEQGLCRRLEDFKKYYNQNRVHSSLAFATPSEKADGLEPKVISLDNLKWESYCDGLFKLPSAA